MNQDQLQSAAERLLAAHGVDTALRDALADILSGAWLRRVAAGERLCREGDPGVDLWVLVSGSVQVSKRDFLGVDKPLAEVPGPTLLGQLSVVDGSPRNATLTVVMPGVLAVLDAARCQILQRDFGPRGDTFRRLMIASMARQLSRGHAELRQIVADGVDTAGAREDAEATLEGWRGRAGPRHTGGRPEMRAASHIRHPRRLGVADRPHRRHTLPMLLLLAACATDKPDTSEPEDTADTGPRTPGTVELGAACPLSDRIGEIALVTYGDPKVYVQGQVWDKPDPWVGPPTLSTETCDFHQFTVTGCGTCDSTEVCSFDGACVPQRRALPVTLSLTTDGATETFTSDVTTGKLYGEAGASGSAYTLAFTVEGQTVEIPESTIAASLEGLVVTVEGHSMAPGALTATWTPGVGRVRTIIPINHHAAGPTFTRCDVPSETGTFHADAEMITPLAVVTGLEFQGVEVANAAAAWVDVGCVDVRLGTSIYTAVEWTAR
jgi:CRP-like cAMP-binding protein